MELSVQGVTKRYGKVTALNDICLCVEPGIYGLIGPNGAGKSTLMNLIAGIMNPTEGAVCFDGLRIGTLGAAYRKRLGYLPQVAGYYSGLTARRFLEYIAVLKGVEKRMIRLEIDRVLGLVNLTEKAGSRIGGFSGGMKQRIGIAQALLGNPDILVLDEPTAGLDPKERIRIKTYLAQLAQEHIVLLATHIVSDVESIANGLFLLKNGRIEAQGSVESLLQSMKGKVWSLQAPQGKLEGMPAGSLVAGFTTVSGEPRARFLSAAPLSGAQSESPNLEDLYLFHFGEEGQNGQADRL